MLKRLLNNLMQMMAKEVRKRTVEEVFANNALSAFADGAVESSESETKRARLGKAKPTKYAMLLSYQGHNYFGMQLQQDAKQYPTIESHLLDAMLKHGFIDEEQRADTFLWYFQRCARTDRHVSAVRQICSMRLPRNDDFLQEGVSLLNSSLPDDIRVFGIKRVTPCFHAQKYCDGRTYSYTLPTFAFAACDELTTDAYRITPERVAEVDEILARFTGSHNFFNYTSRLEHSDQRSMRYIVSFKCDKPFLYTDPVRNREIEFITLYIRGQSFMLHQIRKMMGTVIAIMRGFMYKSDVVRSFQSDRMDIPRAPGLGLLLEQLHFNRFEDRYARTHGSLNHWGNAVEEAINEFRDRHIVQRILREECATQSMMQWLTTLPCHVFLVDPTDVSTENTSALFVAAKNAITIAGGGKIPWEEEEDEDEAEAAGGAVVDDDNGGPSAAVAVVTDDNINEEADELGPKLDETAEELPVEQEEEEEVKVKVAASR